MINLVGPLGITSLSIDGTNYAVLDGKVSVKPEHLAEAKDFGFVPAPETNDDPNFVPSDDIATMTRNELFAFLKAKGVAVSVPITNDQLRAVANQATVDADTAAKEAADKAAADAQAITEKEAADKAAADKLAEDEAAAKALNPSA